VCDYSGLSVLILQINLYEDFLTFQAILHHSSVTSVENRTHAMTVYGDIYSMNVGNRHSSSVHFVLKRRINDTTLSVTLLAGIRHRRNAVFCVYKYHQN